MTTEPFNLIHETWIPVSRADGARQWIAPWQITEGLNGPDPITALDWPRPDFNGACLELLIGLLTTAMAPKDEDGWAALWENPPAPEALKAAFEPLAFAFNLDGDGPRFLQELGGMDSPTQRSLASLLIDQPGEQGIERNADHFIKQGNIKTLSRSAAAMALYTVQAYSPAGGRGFLTSMRGGGPLTTLAIMDPKNRLTALWHQLWPNVPVADWPDWRSKPEHVFPWLAATRGSQAHPVTTPEHGHPLQAFFGMPRRAHLIFEPAQGRDCDLGGPADALLATGWQTQQYGIKYEGWQHPLSPYVAKAGTTPSSVKGNPGGVTYRHWLGLVVAGGNDKDKRLPARSIATAIERASDAFPERVRLQAFGFDMDNMKARCWYQSSMPVPMLKAGTDSDLFETRTKHLVGAAELVSGLVRFAVKQALFSRPADAPGDFSSLGEQFWRGTEQDFLAHLSRLGVDPQDQDETIRKDWMKSLIGAAIRQFDATVPTLGIENGAMKRVVSARSLLLFKLHDGGLEKALGLEAPERKPKRKGKKEAA
ncbi:MAG: type I-E CRISPR-associated protein Cse1/CasA [Alphaproteobacteria bacterium]|nr:type I-E CRISPR-associated protein Cse1/CasA [Alphaproteobacteria bacterium]